MINLPRGRLVGVSGTSHFSGGITMANEFAEKPSHYDGSTAPTDWAGTDSNETETYVLTPEARKNLSGNPFFTENEEN
jgi:hypothetical protein